MSDLGDFQGVDPIAFESVSAVTATPNVDIGTRRIVNGEEYVYFYNATGSAATQGVAMIMSGLSGYSLTRSSTAAADFAVCFVKHADVPAGSYAWGLVRGLVSVQAANTLAAGVNITLADDGEVQTLVGGSFPTGICVGKMLSATVGTSASGSDGKGLAFVRCWG